MMQPAVVSAPESANQEPTPTPLGAFLRAQRARLRPDQFDLPRGSRRRVPGLRREEAAQLCGISATWYTWIEQGRTTAISVEALSAIARGLRLSVAERAYLFQLADRADPHPPVDERDPHGLATLVRAIHSPAYVLDRHWDAIAWNDPAAQLFTDWLGSAQHLTPNLLRYVFTHPRAPAFIDEWQERTRRLVAEYRADTAPWREDPQRHLLVRELSAASAAFDAAWRSQQVQGRDGGARSFRTGNGERRDYEQYVARLAQRPDLKLTILVPA